MNLDPLIQAQIDGRLFDSSYCLRIDSTPPTLAWTGVGPIEIESEVYAGIGLITEIPGFTSLINGQANRVDLSLSGVDANITALANEDAAVVRGKAVKMGLLFLDHDLQVIGSPIWVAPDYTADVISTDSASSSDFGRVRKVTLSIGSSSTGRRRPPINFWTKAQQFLRSATDAFCDYVARYTNDSTIKWP